MSNRVFEPEFRVKVAKRIVAGESVTKIHHEFAIKRSMLYRWRDAYRKDGAAGLERAVGRPPGTPNPAPKPGASEADGLRQHIAQLERKVGQQQVMLDFFQRAFKRVKESNQAHASAGATASTRKSKG